MFLTHCCVAGYSTYRRGETHDEVLVEDGCHVDTPKGRLKTVKGTGKIEDFGTTNAKMRVRYPFLITFNCWVLCKSPDKTWFISANPSMKDLLIYSRTVPSKVRLQRMVRKAGDLGYDVSKHEFPAARKNINVWPLRRAAVEGTRNSVGSWLSLSRLRAKTR